MSYEVSLEVFEGPLDLLLYLIQKDKINIYDISIAEITTQYLTTIRQWQENNMEIASEFIVMASRLLEIKSNMLLPRTDKNTDETEDPRQALIDQLIEYQIFKQIGLFFRDQEIKEIGTVFKEPEYFPELESENTVELDAGQLGRLYRRLVAISEENRIDRFEKREIVLDRFTVEEKIELLRKALADKRNRPLYFSDLVCENGGKSEAIASFQAILEYYKVSSIRLIQKELFREIMISQENDERKNESRTDDNQF